MAIPTPPPEMTETPSQPPLTAADRHSLAEQQAALNLAQFAAQASAPNETQKLIDALIVSLAFSSLNGELCDQGNQH
jgi:hypothetical protein